MVHNCSFLSIDLDFIFSNQYNRYSFFVTELIRMTMYDVTYVIRITGIVNYATVRKKWVLYFAQAPRRGGWAKYKTQFFSCENYLDVEKINRPAWYFFRNKKKKKKRFIGYPRTSNYQYWTSAFSTWTPYTVRLLGSDNAVSLDEAHAFFPITEM